LTGKFLTVDDCHIAEQNFCMNDISKQRIDWIDSARALAIIGVVFVHCANFAVDKVQYPELFKLLLVGRLGVQLFFVISALTIIW
jgi:peptidoglycan/LPS O-acetylase OafA/YrhL